VGDVARGEVNAMGEVVANRAPWIASTLRLWLQRAIAALSPPLTALAADFPKTVFWVIQR